MDSFETIEISQFPSQKYTQKMQRWGLQKAEEVLPQLPGETICKHKSI